MTSLHAEHNAETLPGASLTHHVPCVHTPWAWAPSDQLKPHMESSLGDQHPLGCAGAGLCH